MNNRILKIGDSVQVLDFNIPKSVGKIKSIYSRSSGLTAISVGIYSAFDVELCSGYWVPGYKVRLLNNPITGRKNPYV